MFLKWSNIFRTPRAGGWRARWVKRIVNFIKMVAEGVEIQPTGRKKKASPSSFILLHITLPPIAQPNV